MGTGATAIAAFVSAWAAQSAILAVHGVLFLITTYIRYREAIVFDSEDIAADDADLAEVWERRAMLIGGFAALNYGMWCFSSLVFAHNEFAELASVSVSVAALVGIVGRNFGVDRLLVLQSVLVGVPLCSALVLTGELYHVLLASLFAPMIVSFRSVAKDVRGVLLNAVHDRVEVTKLVNELDTTLETVAHGICMLDTQFKVAVANPQFVDMVLGVDPGSVIGKSFRDLIAEAENSGALSRLTAERMLTAIANGARSKIVLQLVDKIQCEVSISFRDEQIALVVEDISERIEIENRIRFMARYDGLTGLPNRTYFTDQVNQKLEEHPHHSAENQSLLAVVDLDDFKHINDSLGHPVGDNLLQQVADRIRLNLDSRFMVGRFGGDEFTIFAENNCSAETAKHVVEKLMDVISAPYVVSNEVLIMRFSMGYVLGTQSSGDLEGMFKRADLALYAAKGRGKGQFVAFHEDMDREYNQRELLKKDLQSALENDGISLAYQPIIDVKTGVIKGCEALARWYHPEHGNISPVVFIPIAEDIGMINELSAWVLRKATEECAGWPRELFVSVNISARDFQTGNVEQMVDDALVNSGLPANRLELEVTESVLIEERERASRTLRAIAARGAGIALDDFGTGYSSLAYVHDMPFTKLKIDRAFTADVTTDPKALKLMRSIARMSRELDMQVTVEGVETQEQLDAIVGLDLVDLVQGFHFGIPVPQYEIAEMINVMSAPKDRAARPKLQVEKPKRPRIIARSVNGRH